MVRVRSWRVSIRPRCSARSTVRGDMPTASSRPWRNGTWPVWPKRCCRFWTPAISTSWNGWNRWWPGLPCALTGIGPGSCAPSWAWPLKSRTTAPWRTTSCSCCSGKRWTSRWRSASCPTPSRGRMPHCTTCSDGSARRSRTGFPIFLGQ